MRSDGGGWTPFAAWRRRNRRLDAAVEVLERAGAAAEAERARLAEAVAVSRAALVVLHERLVELAQQPAHAAEHARALMAHAESELRTAAATVATAAADRVATEMAPARLAAEEHAAFMRASLDRLRGETEALSGAQEAASVLVALSGTAQTGFTDALTAFARRLEAAADAAGHAIARLEAAASRVEAPPPARAATRRRE